MKSGIKRFVVALAASVVVTLGLFGLASVSYDSHPRMTYILYWQGYSLQSLVPAPNLGTPEHPLYEGTPVHMVAFYAGIPVGVVIYFVAAFLFLSLVAKHRATNKALQPTSLPSVRGD